MHTQGQWQAERRAEAHREEPRRQRWAHLPERERHAIPERVAGQLQSGQLAAMHGQTLWRRRPLWQAIRPLLDPQSQALVILAKG